MSSNDTCKYMILGAIVIAIGVILFSGEPKPCINCDKPKEKPNKEVQNKPKRAKAVGKPQEKKMNEEQPAQQIAPFEEGDFASF